MLTSDDVDRIRAHPWLEQVHYRSQIDSTNDWARRFLQQAAPKSHSAFQRPQLFLAADQTAGRGRGEHRWWSGPGNLTTTLVIPPVPPLQRAFPPALPLATGLALVLAIQKTCPKITPALKWPNDIYVGTNKLAGILTETLRFDSRAFVLVGIGCNISSSDLAAPTELKGTFASLNDLAGRRIDLVGFLLTLLDHLQKELDQLARNPAAVIRRCQAHLVWEIGQGLRIERAGESPLVGNFLGLGHQGQLRIDVAGTEHLIASAHHVRPVD